MNVDTLSLLIERLIVEMDLPVLLQGEQLSAGETASPIGLLPVLLLEADRIWRLATGNPVGLGLVRDDDATLGFTVLRHPAAPPAVVLIAVQQVLAEAARAEPDYLYEQDPGPAIRLTAVGERWFAALNRAPVPEPARSVQDVREPGQGDPS